jgi:iron complex transport system substrate-binding protein
VKFRPMVALLAALAMLMAACGAEAEDSANSDITSAPDTSVTTEAMSEDEQPDTTKEVVDEAEFPSSIVSLSATSTEILFAIGAGGQVVAVDSFSNYPSDAPTTDLSAFEPNLEAIVAYDPDLVVISYDPGELVAGLEAVGIPTIVHFAATNLDDVYSQVADLGVATGQIDGAAEVNAQIRAGIEKAVADAPASETPIRVYHEVDNTFYSATSSTFIGQMYELLGMTNVADVKDADGSNFGYPQLSPEYLIESDPQMIVITDQVGYGADDVAARPGWGVLSAVKSGDIVQIDADIASRWGPRIVEFLEQISAAVSAVPVS